MTRKPRMATKDDQTRRFAAKGISDDTRKLTAEILTMREAFAVLRRAVERRALDRDGLQKDLAADFVLRIDELQKDLAGFLLVWPAKN